jgi:Protein of unknown function (DUF2439)
MHQPDTVWSVLYTTQLTKKRKQWIDGKLTSASTGVATLRGASGAVIVSEKLASPMHLEVRHTTPPCSVHLLCSLGYHYCV